MIICQFYQDFLSHYIASELTPISTLQPYPMILVDEAQDFSYAQLESLYHLSAGNLVYFLGDHQILFDGKSRLPFLSQLFYRNEKEFNAHQLSGSYRCSQAVVNVTNMLIQLKYQVTGGAADKGELAHIVSAKEDDDQGELLWIDSYSKELEALQQEAAKNTRFAVVTFPEFVDEAKKAFKTPLVFTPEQIKGLEYDAILVWRPLDVKDSTVACTKLKDNQSIANTTTHRAKAGEGDDSCLPYFNRLITAVTRAKRKLIVVQDKKHPTKAMYDALLPTFNNDYKQPVPSQVPLHQSTPQDWEDEARKLLQQGNASQALDIFLNVLGRTKSEFKTFQQGLINPTISIVGDNKTQEKENIQKIESPKEEPPPSLKKKKNTQLSSEKKEPQKKKEIQLSPEENALQELMNNFSEKRLAIVLSVFEFTKILTQTRAIPKSSGKPQTLLEFILTDLDHTKSFLKLTINDYKFTDNFIRNYTKISHFYNKKHSAIGSGKKNFDRFCAIVNKFSNGTGNTDLNLTHIVTVLGDLNSVEFLHQLGADFDKPNSYGATPTYIAAAHGHIGLIDKFYQYNANLNQATNEGNTPAYVAAENGHVAVIVKLHECKADIHKPNTKGATPAYIAAQNGHANLIAKLHEYGADLDKPTLNGGTPAYIAAEKGCVDVIIKLHECKAELHRAKPSGATPFFIAAYKGHVNVLAKLYEYGADPNASTTKGFTPVYIAAQNGHVAVLDKLYECGADFNKAEKQGTTPAYIAAENGHGEVLERLYKYGADLNKADDKGITPVFVAADVGNLAIIETLHKCGADLNKADKKGATPIFIAAYNRNIAVIETLDKFGADLDKENLKGSTPTFIAAQKGYADVIETLYKLGADIDKANKEGASPLHVAVDNGHIDVIIKLHQCQAKLNCCTIRGETPAYTAAQKGDAAVIEALYQCGADLNKADTRGVTPAYIAAQNGHAAAIEALYKCGVELDKADDKGVTPVFKAATNGHAAVIKKFHECKVDVNKPDKQGLTPAFLAVYFGRVAVIEQLYECGVDLDKPSAKGSLLTVTAAIQGQVAILEKLHDYNVNLNQADIKGTTPVFAAVRYGRVNVIQKLYEYGVNFESLNAQQETLVHVAIKEKMLNVLTTLYELDVNWDRALNGITPAHIAIQGGDIDFIKLMLEKNIKFNIPHVTNKVELRQLIEACIKKDKSNEGIIVSKMEQFLERKSMAEDKISISPLELAEIIDRQDIVKLIKPGEVSYQHSYRFFKSKQTSETNEASLKLEL
ncbi:Ankyrin repeat protein [Legionella hackeliae]|uniref:ankyrin repeat domain-containing protein n=1 Tax=Legionella hackeliae TaxID=449 RepID=UPI000E11ECA5|nr:ankyrin repeat domain-containing protein [Legionella hackeliae]STX49684.1 Ankyrin repeat protein [Legionella hackeliae]